MCGCEIGLYGMYEGDEEMIGALEDIKPSHFVDVGVAALGGATGYVAATQVEKLLTINKDGTKKTKGFLATDKDQDMRDGVYVVGGLGVSAVSLVSTGRISQLMLGFGLGMAGYGVNRQLQKRFPKVVYTPTTAPAVSGYDNLQRNPTRHVLSGINQTMDDLMKGVEVDPVQQQRVKQPIKEHEVVYM